MSFLVSSHRLESGQVPGRFHFAVQVAHNPSRRQPGTMEPLAALGLAAAVVQFVSFTSQVITAVAAGDSAAGAPAELASLDDIYGKLRAISQKLGNASRASAKALDGDSGGGAARPHWTFQPSWEQLLGPEDGDPSHAAYFPTLRDSYRSLAELSSLCENECDKILAIMEKLRASHNPSSRWSTLSTAVKLLFKKNEIKELEGRLRRFHRVVLTEMCNLST